VGVVVGDAVGCFVGASVGAVGTVGAVGVSVVGELVGVRVGV